MSDENRKKPKTGDALWDWAKARWETSGATDTELQAAIKGAFGITVPLPTIRTKRRRHGWARNPSPDALLPVAPEGIDVPVESLISKKNSLGLIRADEALARIQLRHDVRRDRVAEAGMEILDGAVETWRALRERGQLTAKEAKPLADAMARGADMIGSVEDRERKARGLDRPENQPQPTQGVTQILINVQAPSHLSGYADSE